MKVKAKIKKAPFDPLKEPRDRALKLIAGELHRMIAAVDESKATGHVEHLDAVATILRVGYEMIDSHRVCMTGIRPEIPKNRR